MNDPLARGPASSGVSFGGQSFGDQSLGGQAGVARCSICELPVSLETAKTDEYVEQFMKSAMRARWD